MTEQKVLTFTCRKCKKENFPYGPYKLTDLPCTIISTCKYCGYQGDFTWGDSKLNADFSRIKAGLPLDSTNSASQIQALENEIESLKSSKNADRKEIDALNAIVEACRKEVQIIRELIDLTVKNQVKELKEKDGEHTEEIDSILDRLNNLEQELKFLRDGK